jgi:hypothetical protein
LLSQSFRFGQAVADVANSILAGLDEPTDLEMKGLGSIPSVVLLEDGEANPDAILTRTNACAVGHVLSAFDAGKRPHLVGGGADVVAFVRAALDLQAGKPTSHMELCCFESWGEVQEYVKTDEGEDLKLFVKLIDEFGGERILAALQRMPKEEHADLVVCTAHKSKGREWNRVKLTADFPTANKMSDPDRRLLYVAATRAKYVLDLSECPPFKPAEDDEGHPIKPIVLRWTTPMPSRAELGAWIANRPTKEPERMPIHQDDIAPGPATVTPPPQPFHRDANGPEFTWASNGGEWLVRGPGGRTGQKVTVTRRNGSTTQETLGEVARTFPEAVLYRVRK